MRIFFRDLFKDLFNDFWAIVTILVLIAVCVTALCQRDYVTRKYQAANITIDALETTCRLQARDIENWVADNYELNIDYEKLWEDIRGHKARAEALEGRIRKMAGAYHVREMNLVTEIKRLEELLWFGILPPPGDWLKSRPNKSPGFLDPPGIIIEEDDKETDDGRHHQAKAWTRVAHSKETDTVPPSEEMDSGGDARERLPEGHSRPVSVPERLGRTVGRREAPKEVLVHESPEDQVANLASCWDRNLDSNGCNPEGIRQTLRGTKLERLLERLMGDANRRRNR